MPKKKPHIKLTLLYLFSAISLSASVYWYIQRFGYLLPKTSPVMGDIQVAGAISYTGDFTSPSAIALPSLGVNLPVVITYMEGKKWPTTPSGVSYLANSAVPGDVGNAVFYGHNWPSILGNLGQVKIGDKLVIQYQNGKSKDFIIDNVFTVGPNSTDILASSDTPKITLYTCTGFLDSKRLVVTAI